MKREGNSTRKEMVRRCTKCGTDNRRRAHRCKACNARMETRPGFFVPEPGDEDLSPMMLDCKYHVPFEGTVFALRPDPDPEILTALRRRARHHHGG
jgi:hypothetical protein